MKHSSHYYLIGIKLFYSITTVDCLLKKSLADTAAVVLAVVVPFFLAVGKQSFWAKRYI